MIQNNWDIVVITKDGLEVARKEAIKQSQDIQGWCHVSYIDKILVCESYHKGSLYATRNCKDFLFSLAGSTKILTVLNAMVKYGDTTIKNKAIALGATGNYTKEYTKG